MSFLKLSWCQLIKIILSQVGGNPLQQVYSQLNQGMATMAPGGILPPGLSEIKNLIETTVQVINAAQAAVNNYTDVVDRMAQQFFQNPVGTLTNETISATNAKIASINTQLAAEEAAPGTLTAEVLAKLQSEKTFLTGLASDLTSFKLNTDKLSGVGTQNSNNETGCSLQDLLGSGCNANQDVPDVDIQQLIESLKKGDAIAAVKQKILDATGVSDLAESIRTFKLEIASFNTNFTNTLNKAAVRNAVTGQLTQIVFNLLTGCGNQVFDLTLKTGVKAAIQPYVTLLEQQRDGTAYTNRATGEVTNSFPEDKTTIIAGADITVDANVDKATPRKYYLNGIEVSKEAYDRATIKMNDSYRNAIPGL